MKKQRSKPTIKTCLAMCLLALGALLISQAAIAHNKVVVVPLVGDETPLEPTAPVAKVDTSQSDYIIMENTTIDRITGLEWQREDDGVGRNWNEAFNYCAGLSLDGKQDWRLPDVVELQSIVDFGQVFEPRIDRVAFPNSASGYWSASILASNPDRVWQVFFFSSFSLLSKRKTGLVRVRCVR